MSNTQGKVTRKFHQDAGHGWLAVKRAELAAMSLLHSISAYSYQRGETVYLEEDRDAGVYLQAMKARGVEVSITAPPYGYPNRSPIRSYEGFKL